MKIVLEHKVQQCALSCEILTTHLWTGNAFKNTINSQNCNEKGPNDQNWLLHHHDAPALTSLKSFWPKTIKPPSHNPTKNNEATIPQPPYSPNLAPCNFPGTKRRWICYIDSQGNYTGNTNALLVNKAGNTINLCKTIRTKIIFKLCSIYFSHSFVKFFKSNQFWPYM